MNRFFYSALLYLLLPFTPIKLFWRAKKQPEYLQHWAERYGFYAPLASKPENNKPIIWLHCVSVGETMAAAPLVNALLAHYPQHQILLTHTTPTGRVASEQLFGTRVLRAYLPFDVPYAVKKFLIHFKPAIGMLMETELWFNLIAEARQRDIPILLINARLSEKSARGYAKLGRLARDGLNQLSVIAAQTAADATRLTELRDNAHAAPIGVFGNIKFDVTPPADALTYGVFLREALQNQTIDKGKRPIFLAASTRSLEGVDEESLVLDAVKKCKGTSLLTVIVPRHPQRFKAIESLLQQRGLRYAKRSSLGDLANVSHVDKGLLSNIDVLLGDSMGEMFMYYACCDVAFIGGSLLKLGGQNLIEASAMGKPTLVGPHTFNFTQVVDLAISAGATKRVQDVDALANALTDLLGNTEKQQTMATAARNFSQLNQGATTRLLNMIKPFIH